MEALIHHVLPGNDGDTSWFYRQNSFEQQEIFRQVAFKRRRWPTMENGRQSEFPTHTYPHILPDGCHRLALYEPLVDEILSFREHGNVAFCSEALNHKYSQTYDRACRMSVVPISIAKECEPVLTSRFGRKLKHSFCSHSQVECHNGD